VTAYGSAVLEALADPTRRSIFERLGRGPTSVVDIARDLPISRPAVSQHLKVLKDARLVTVRPEGTRRIYALDPHGLRAVREYFEQFWVAALADFAAAAETNPDSS
jgi:DNA-binding transcriptional ArsR family regulator